MSGRDEREFSIRRPRPVPAPDPSPTVPVLAARDSKGTIRLHVAGRTQVLTAELARSFARSLDAAGEDRPGR
jgi:hypothetical protein